MGGGADRGTAALRARVRRFPAQRRGWELLADAEERRGDLKAAAVTVDEIGRHFGADLAQSVRAARLRRSLGESSAALASLSKLAGDAPETQVDFWRLLGALAWEVEDRAIAARAYRVLWEGGNADMAAAERLVLLDREAGRSDEAIRVARAGWARMGQPRLLLLGADTASATGQWDVLAELLDAAALRESDFGTIIHYRLLRARLLEHQGRVPEALEEFRQALILDPRSSEARAGVVWLLAGAGKWQPLTEALEGWSKDAWVDPMLWRPWAAGLDALGRHLEASAYWRRVALARSGGEAAAAGRGQAWDAPGASAECGG
jgi:tetratricopeptide (TPR) repeat protein